MDCSTPLLAMGLRPRSAILCVSAAALVGVAEVHSAQPLADNLRLTLDVASRNVLISPGSEHASAHFLGVDLHKVFTGEQGDIGTLTVQPYLIRIDNMAMHPPFFDGPNDWAVEYRIVNFNYTGLGRGRPNIRVGHFEIPFGLEQVINTNGTLHDYLHGPNLGVKADWGLSLNGDLPRFEYEFALTRGSGNDWSDLGNPYIVSGRIGTARERQWAAGLSVFTGRVTDVSRTDFTTQRERAALDLQWHGPRFDLRAEISAGSDESLAVRTAVVEVDTANTTETLKGYLQLIRRENELTGSAATARATSAGLGVLFTPDRHWSISAQWSRDLDAAGAPEMSMLAGQLRYRF